jgi:hypothetical protein
VIFICGMINPTGTQYTSEIRWVQIRISTRSLLSDGQIITLIGQQYSVAYLGMFGLPNTQVSDGWIITLLGQHYSVAYLGMFGTKHLGFPLDCFHHAFVGHLIHVAGDSSKHDRLAAFRPKSCVSRHCPRESVIDPHPESPRPRLVATSPKPRCCWRPGRRSP